MTGRRSPGRRHAGGHRDRRRHLLGDAQLGLERRDLLREPFDLAHGGGLAGETVHQPADDESAHHGTRPEKATHVILLATRKSYRKTSSSGMPDTPLDVAGRR